jgi:hypothetical protein
VGHEFKHYPFFNDKLKQLLKDEVMNIYHPISPSATIRLFNAPIQGTQMVMHPSLGNMVVLINYQLTWQPLVTPFVPSQNNVFATSTYPMSIMSYHLTFL